MADSTNPLIPPADFLFLVESVLMQAQMQLGLVNFGTGEEGADDENDSKPDLASARHSIDLLGMLQEKTKGNLTTEEQRLLDNGLTELRFRFVQIANEMKGEASALSESSAKDSGPKILLPMAAKDRRPNKCLQPSSTRRFSCSVQEPVLEFR